MCHDLEWRAWELVKDEERREAEEPRVVDVPAEPETVEPESEPERELVHA
jgi:hypothetical protein